MSMIPLVLPLKANEAAALADLVYQQLEGHPLTADLRNRFAARLPQLALETFTPFPGSLARDPIHPSTYYLAIDTHSGPMLLRIALASSPASGLFPGAMLIGRMRPGGGREIVINAVPFQFHRPRERPHLRQAGRLARSCRDLKARNRRSSWKETDSSSAFRAFRAILKSTGFNLAAIAGDYDTALWSAIRAGWREGWNAQSSDPSAPEYTKYSVEGSVEQLDEIYERIHSAKAGHVFDFEIATPGDIGHALDWMKSRGKPVQFVKTNFDSGIRELAAIARQCNAILSFTAATETELEQIGVATAGRFHYRMPASQCGEEAIRLAASSLLGKIV